MTNKENFMGMSLRQILTSAELYATSFARTSGHPIGTDPAAAAAFVCILEGCRTLLQFPIGEQDKALLLRFLNRVAKDSGVEL